MQQKSIVNEISCSLSDYILYRQTSIVILKSNGVFDALV
jgi:hypothetical protein